MKVVVWCDVWPGCERPSVLFFAPSCPVSPGGKRYRIEFEVPDPVDVDGVITDAKVTTEPERGRE